MLTALYATFDRNSQPEFSSSACDQVSLVITKRVVSCAILIQIQIDCPRFHHRYFFAGGFGVVPKNIVLILARVVLTMEFFRNLESLDLDFLFRERSKNSGNPGYRDQDFKISEKSRARNLENLKIPWIGVENWKFLKIQSLKIRNSEH